MSQRPRFPARLTPLAELVSKRSLATAVEVLGSQPDAKARERVLGEVPQPLPTWGQDLSVSTQAYRHKLMQTIQRQGVDDERVLQAIGRIERHRFVDSGLQGQAYEDTSLPIGAGQTISKPNVVARMLALLLQAPLCQRGEGLARVLEVGTGCGYQAAVLSLLCKEVYSVERIKELHLRAKSNLRPFRLPNVHLIFQDGSSGYPKGAPYSGIISAAGADVIPNSWYEQLAIGGRLVAPQSNERGQQSLVVVDRTRQGFETSLCEDVQFVPLKSGTE
jgi:protein-L-isoaspartate(D-aspartate) O-methyltransferase